MNFLRRSKEPWVPTTTEFPELNIRQLSIELRLEERGRSAAAGGTGGPRGPRGPDDDDSEDQVEHEIRQRLMQLYRGQQSVYQQALDIVDARLREASLDAQADVVIRKHAVEALADLKVHISEVIPRLQLAKRSAEQIGREYDNFVVANKLQDVEPVIVTPRDQLWIIAIVSMIFLAEAFLNAFFFAKGSTQGLLGGFIEAANLSLINVTLALILSRIVFPEILHRRVARKLIGFICIPIVVVAILSVNIVIAHYRQAFMIADGESVHFQHVLTEVATTPLEIDDATSWLLMLIGIIFNAGACWKFHGLTDKYPGFGRIAYRRHVAQRAFLDERERTIKTLKDMRDAAHEEMTDVREDVRQQSRDFTLATRSRSRLNTGFRRFVEQLRDAYTQLIEIYRVAAGRPRTHRVLDVEGPADEQAIESGDTSPYEAVANAMDDAIASISVEYQHAVARLTPESAQGLYPNGQA